MVYSRSMPTCTSNNPGNGVLLTSLASMPGNRPSNDSRTDSGVALCACTMKGDTTKANAANKPFNRRSEEHTSELQSLMRISYAVFCLKKKITQILSYTLHNQHY